MKQKFSILHLFIFLISGNIVLGNVNLNDDEPGIIKGTIIDNSTRQPMEFANIAVYSKSDSALITGGISGPEGSFEINGIALGEYYLEANFVGYQKTSINNIYLLDENPLFNAGKLSLTSSDLLLGSIDVVADKATVEYKLDKKVVNVSQHINADGGTAIDVLENTPSVEVDLEGNVSLRGSANFTVLIDGRPSVLSGSEALRQIPAAALENIEIITNPSAKYEPDGTAGIINLVMKKNSMNGLSGIINASVGTSDKYRGDFTLNYRTEKINWFIGGDYRDETSFGEMTSERETYLGDTTNFLNQTGNRDFTRSGFNIKSGIDFFLSDKTTLTVSGSLGNSQNNRSGGGNTHEFTLPQSNDIYSVSEEISASDNNFYNANANFIHNFSSEGHKLEILTYYSNRKGNDNEEEGEFLADNNYNMTDTYLDRVKTIQDENRSEFRLKADYTLPLNDDSRFEAGFQSELENELQETNFEDYDQASDSWYVNDVFTSSTDFKRNIHAVYSTYSNKLGGLHYLAGLRGELTIREIINSNLSDANSLNRFDLFPTLHLSHKIGQKNELMASFSRRINRPRGRDLDPNPGYWNRYSIRIGNPDLKPEYTNSWDLSFMKRFGEGGSYISLEAFRRITNNKIDRIQSVGEGGIYYQMVDNFDKDFSTGVELMTNADLTKWLTVNASVTMFNYKITGELNGVSIDRESTNWNSRMNTTIKFSKNSRAQIQGFYRGPSASAQGESKGFMFTNFSYRHDLFDRKLTATLSVQDI
ncbi:MAG: TonB-dependent receptor, partial [Prolixibacteraceae bacterium]|nr:TonB-dependent receptor [Prolixibacteraceae bacterium]